MRLWISHLITGTVLSVSLLAHATQHANTVVPANPTSNHMKGSTDPARSESDKSKTAPETPTSTTAPLNIDPLAQVTGIMSYCKAIDPKGASEYGFVLSNLLSGYSPAALKSDQRTSQYASGLAAVSVSLARIPKSTGINACRTLIPGK